MDITPFDDSRYAETFEMNEAWVPNNDELTQCVLLIQALRDPTRSDHKMALSVSCLELILSMQLICGILTHMK